MGFFSLHKSKVRYGVMVDIGSGSVLASIIASDESKSHPDIIWSKREYTPIRQINSVSDSAKSVMTSLINVLMTLDSEGRKVFFEKTGEQKLPHLQVTIAAPWSYTATKTISYQNNENFEVTDTLVEELLRTAEQKVQEELLENEHVLNLGLKVIARTTLQVIGNGYPLKITGKQEVQDVKVVEASAVAQKYLVEAILDAKEKMLPSSNLTQYSFMLPFFFVMNDINKPTTEYCLVDITYEATEIGIVREGVLSYCTHMPFGSFSVARELSQALLVPLEEAYSYLNETDLSAYLEKYSEKQKEEVNAILKSYQEKLVALFKETGDSLAIPKKIYLHGNLKTEPFFNKQITLAANAATSMQHAAYNVSQELLTKHYEKEAGEALRASAEDTALLISAQFFHTHDYHDKFEQL
jgi:hypothetical protein